MALKLNLNDPLNINQEQQDIAMKNAHEIILSNDVENYVKETGISKEMMDYILFNPVALENFNFC